MCNNLHEIVICKLLACTFHRHLDRGLLWMRSVSCGNDDLNKFFTFSLHVIFSGI